MSGSEFCYPLEVALGQDSNPLPCIDLVGFALLRALFVTSELPYVPVADIINRHLTTQQVSVKLVPRASAVNIARSIRIAIPTNWPSMSWACWVLRSIEPLFY